MLLLPYNHVYKQKLLVLRVIPMCVSVRFEAQALIISGYNRTSAYNEQHIVRYVGSATKHLMPLCNCLKYCDSKYVRIDLFFVFLLLQCTRVNRTIYIIIGDYPSFFR